MRQFRMDQTNFFIWFTSIPHILLYPILKIFHHGTTETLQVLAIAPQPFSIFLSGPFRPGPDLLLKGCPDIGKVCNT